ncbi:MAG: DUF2339 domain-containing protein [Campylobacteraceae bacterium]|jgi:uncharacterized membrane protein|nr:DUF2339 domain-containing protein [Campylobacteraceae bacterium]
MFIGFIGIIEIIIGLCVIAIFAFPIIVIVMINNLKQRVKYLEKKLETSYNSPSKENDSVILKPKTDPITQTIAPARSFDSVQNSGVRPRLQKIDRKISLPHTDTQFDKLKERFIKWLGENFIAKIAIVILFFGISFLLKYSIEHGMLSPQIRVLGSLILGFTLFGTGWRLRNFKNIYALILEGGGIGVLYLTIFAAFKIYAFIPVSVAFALLVVICALSVYFAVLQNAISLAILAFVGAYLSPVLLSSSEGEHIVLFSYYTIISLALVVISRWRSWRVLNLIGFIFTIAVTSLWYIKSYNVEFYPETQAFVIANLLIFGILAVLLFVRHERESTYHNAVDIAFLFGTPILSYALEYHILPRLEFASAFAALGFGLFYLTGSFVILKRFKDAGKRTSLYMLGIGIGFATLAVPLAFDNDAASLIWLFEGSAITWIAIKNNQYKLSYFGLLITLFGAVLFIYQNNRLNYTFDTSVVMNTVLFFNACLFYRFQSLDKSLKISSYVMLLLSSLSWIYWISGLSEISYYYFYDYNNFSYMYFALAFVFLSWFWYFVGRSVKWEILECALISLWPSIFFTMLYHDTEENSFFYDISYLLAFASAYFYLYKGSFFKRLYKNMEAVLHVSLFWAILLWIYDKLQLFADTFILWYYQEYLEWSLFGVVFAAVILIVMIFQKRDLFPFNRFVSIYRYIGLAPVAFFLIIKLLSALAIGYQFGLQYIPILNPLEESVIFVLIVLKFYIDNAVQNRQKRVVFFTYMLFAFICFLEFNSIVLRAVSCFFDIPWSYYLLWNSEIAQSVFSIIWTFLALFLIIFANKSKNRKIWFIGMALLVIVVIKLVLHDSVKLEGLFRASVFIGVALLMLVIGFLAPIPPKENIDIKKD